MANYTEPIFNPITKDLSNAGEKVTVSNELKRQSSSSQSQIDNNDPSKRENPFTVDDNPICRR